MSCTPSRPARAGAAGGAAGLSESVCHPPAGPPPGAPEPGARLALAAAETVSAANL
jgi:hypothetical protein